MSCWHSPYHLSLVYSSCSNLSPALASQRNSLLHSDWSPGRRQATKGRKGLVDFIKYYLCPHTQVFSFPFYSKTAQLQQERQRQGETSGETGEGGGLTWFPFHMGRFIPFSVAFFLPTSLLKSSWRCLLYPSDLIIKYWQILGSSSWEHSISETPCAWTQYCFCRDHSLQAVPERRDLSKSAYPNFREGKLWETKWAMTGAGQPLLSLRLVSTADIQCISWAKPEFRKVESTSMQHAVCYHPSSCKKSCPLPLVPCVYQ